MTPAVCLLSVLRLFCSSPLLPERRGGRDDITHQSAQEAAHHDAHRSGTGDPDNDSHHHRSPDHERGLNRPAHQLLEQDQGPVAPEVESRNDPRYHEHQAAYCSTDLHSCFYRLVLHDTISLFSAVAVFFQILIDSALILFL